MGRPILPVKELRSRDPEADGLIIWQQGGDGIDIALLDVVSNAIRTIAAIRMTAAGLPRFDLSTTNFVHMEVAWGCCADVRIPYSSSRIPSEPSHGRFPRRVPIVSPASMATKIWPVASSSSVIIFLSWSA